MPSTTGRRSLSGAVIAGLFALATVPAAVHAAPAKLTKAPTNKAYIVQLADMPVTAYQGGIRGLQATRPNKGQKIDPSAPAVVNYMAYLAARQDAALASVGASKKLYNYGYVFNGFAAELTQAQAQKLAQMPGVVAVTKDTIRRRDTSSTPSFLGLSGPGGFWATQAKGEGIVIGIVDSGIWPEHPSFADRVGSNGNASKDGKLAYQQIPGWNGKCLPGTAFAASDCNQKLIGARYYNAGFGGNAGIAATYPYEFNSPRDADGHGSHTASTAGGNAQVPVTGAAAAFGSISGIAPRARIAAYKVCWGNNGEGGCAGVDSVAAIDQAVADGVDVINFSISGTSTNFLDPVEVAFLFAADAGVFVAASAGNDGPTASTVAHPSPWITTVAAGTHNRDGQGSATLGNGVTYPGASIARALGSTPLIDSTAAGLPGADPTAVRLCFGAADGGVVLDPAKVAGKIVVCDRGVSARTDKSLAVQQAGGLGMILANTSPNSLNADPHAVPSVHVQSDVRAAIKAYAATPGATASIHQGVIALTAPAPFTAAFSSRGPLRAGNGDLLKPDLIAPGQDILAAVSPVGYGGRSFDLLSGTSMSGPHVAGLAALMKELKPTWSPMAIKSALMTTAYDVLDTNADGTPITDAARMFRQGAGHVRPVSAARPGLVFDSGFNDWLGFLCGTGQLTASYCPSIRIDPSNLNLPSIAIGDLPGTQTVTRRVTNVSGNPATFTASVSGMAGLTVVVSPSTLELGAGLTKSFEVSITNVSGVPGTDIGGQLTWTGGGASVRTPMVVRPVALAAPTQVGGSYKVSFGYNGPFGATPRGLIPAAVSPGTVTQDPDQTFGPNDPTGITMVMVEVPAGTTHARFSLFDADVAPGSDIDLYVYDPSGSYVGGSGSGGSDEEVNVVNPAAGSYYVFMHGWGLPTGSSPFKLHTWALGSSAAGNLSVTAPASATVGQTGAIVITTNGLAAGTKYLGSIAYSGPSAMPSPTIVRIDTP